MRPVKVRVILDGEPAIHPAAIDFEDNVFMCQGWPRCKETKVCTQRIIKKDVGCCLSCRETAPDEARRSKAETSNPVKKP